MDSPSVNPQVPFRRPETSDTLAKRRMKEALGQAPKARLEEHESFRPGKLET